MELAYSLRDAAAAAGVGKTALYAAIASGNLRARKCGRRTLVLREDLENWLRSLPVFEDAKAELGANHGRKRRGATA